MASARSSRRYPLRSRNNEEFGKAVGVGDSDRREGMRTTTLDYDHLTVKRDFLAFSKCI